MRCFPVIMCFLSLFGWMCVEPAGAELPQDVHDIFERLIVDLDNDLAKKFQAAVDNDTATVEFTPEQFRRFRDNPINPFDGLDDIDAAEGSGNIALKFQLPSLRNRPLDRFERQHESLKSVPQTVIFPAANSTVTLSNARRPVAMGIIISKDGLIITKASEIENESSLACSLPDGRELPIEILRTDSSNDIALISVHATDLTPIQFSDKQPLLGSFVITPGSDQQVALIGCYSATPRSTAMGEQAFLGVQPQTTNLGVVVADIRPGTASHAAGLRDGDTIFRLGATEIREVADLVRVIRAHRPGDRIEINYLRNGQKIKTHAQLAGRKMSGQRAARFKMMNRLGTIPSRRNDGFPHVFQHDSPLFPEQCGGPIIDLDGNVLGMNIARNGRAASYAIPSNHLKTIIDHLKRENLAARQKKSTTN